jgi:hypothetical protein
MGNRPILEAALIANVFHPLWNEFGSCAALVLASAGVKENHIYHERTFIRSTAGRLPAMGASAETWCG